MIRIRKIFQTILALFLLSVLITALNWNHHDNNNALILKPALNPLLQKIAARFAPPLQTPAKTALLPVSFKKDDFIPQEPSDALFTFNRDQKRELKNQTPISSFWNKDLAADPVESPLVESALKLAAVPVLLNKNVTVFSRHDNDGTPLELAWRFNKDQRVTVKRTSGNQFLAEVTKDIPTPTERIVSGTIYSTFIGAAQSAGLPISLVDDYVDLFGDRIDFRKDLQPGDVFAIILKQNRYQDGTWGEPLEISSASIINDGALKAIVRYKNNDGTMQSYNEKGEPLGAYFLKYPLTFSRISSVFTDSRFHPVLKISRPHNGVDFAAPTGTPVRSVGEGTVEKAGYFGSSGYMVKIKHSSRWSTAYLHLSKIQSGIKAGSKISRGQLIGAVGTTGLSSGPHLHFSLYDNGKYVNPMTTKLPNVINEKNLVSPKIIMASVETMKQQLQAVAYASNAKVSSVRRG
jgi:murein DD-endopeptidase MepM/ murein hydrolase activator NlpD